MPGTAVNIGTFTQISFATTGFTAQVIETVEWSGIARGAVDTTHMRSTAASTGQFGGRTFMPTAFADPGSIALMLHFAPDTNVPIHQPAETIRVTFPLVSGDTTAAYWESSGFITEMAPSIPLEEKMVNRVTVKLSGLVTMTDAT